ncbi:MAG: ribokinase [Fimbriimonadaceae bacterium]|nr:ribokinase [Fimbriimonadaceae bacterium]
MFDISVQLKRVPDTHETVLADSVQLSAGGKGMCQAVAASRLGGTVEMIGLVGQDPFGAYLLEVLDNDHIRRVHVGSHRAGTHLGIPIVTPDGNNRIIGVPRASAFVTPDVVHGSGEAIHRSDVLLVQGETPLDVIRWAIAACSESVLVVWNPAPASFSLSEMLDWEYGLRVAWITPNETEAAQLVDMMIVDTDSAIAAAKKIRQHWSSLGVVITLGDKGAAAIDHGDQVHLVSPFAVRAVDPTAAGDAFTAAFALGIANGSPVSEALEFAAAAGALTATRSGSVPSIPTLSMVRELREIGSTT